MQPGNEFWVWVPSSGFISLTTTVIFHMKIIQWLKILSFIYPFNWSVSVQLFLPLCKGVKSDTCYVYDKICIRLWQIVAITVVTYMVKFLKLTIAVVVIIRWTGLWQCKGVSHSAADWSNKGMLSATSISRWLWRNRPRTKVWSFSFAKIVDNNTNRWTTDENENLKLT